MKARLELRPRLVEVVVVRHVCCSYWGWDRGHCHGDHGSCSHAGAGGGGSAAAGWADPRLWQLWQWMWWRGAALQTAGWRPVRPPARLCSALHGDTSPPWLCSTQQISRSTGVSTDTALPRHTARVSRSTQHNTTRGHVWARRSGYLQTSSSWCRSWGPPGPGPDRRCPPCGPSRGSPSWRGQLGHAGLVTGYPALSSGARCGVDTGH